MKPDAPFLGAGMGSGEIGVIPTLNATTFVAMTQDGKLAEGFEAIYTEMEKVRRYGFTQGEFERAQNDLMRRAERAYANRNDRRNGEFVQTYLNNYQKNQPMPDAETEWQLDSMLIKMLNVDAVNAFAKQTILPTNQVIVINAPEKEGVATPTAEEILAIRDKVAASEVTAYEDNVVKEPLIAEGTVLKGSPVKKTVEDKQLGTTEWTLANGAKVVVKPTTFKADEVRLGVVGKGGLSLLSDEEYYMGEMMPAVNSMSGVGKFSATELKKQLSGKTASVQPSVENYTSAMGGVCSPKDIETMLQLLYLNFTQPRFNKDDVDNLTKMLLAQLANAKSNPDFLMHAVAALEQYGAIAVKRDGAGGGQHLFPAVDGTAGEHFGLLPVGGDDLGQREQLLPQGADGVRFHQAGARGGHHDGVHHHPLRAVLPELFRDDGNQLRRGDHADLHRVGDDIREYGVQLLRQEKRQGLRFPVPPARFPHRRSAGGNPLPGQPGHPAGKGVPSGLPGPWRLLHHRVLQGQVLEVVRQFQGGHLQNSHGLEQRRGELQHLRQFQLLLVFHALSPFPIGSSLMIA